MEASNPPPQEVQTTEELLIVIIEELRSIGSVLARQDERIEALSRAKNRPQLSEWDARSVEVKFVEIQHEFLILTLSTFRVLSLSIWQISYHLLLQHLHRDLYPLS
jgi:hypothetical protein